MAGTVVFNVGGRLFEVLRQTIEARPSTLLASLLEDIGTDAAQPLFVDANSERFSHILDWYRFGEVHLPGDCPIGGILCDARFFLLPDFIKINGTSYSICPGAANNTHKALDPAVVEWWPTFEEYVNGIVDEIRKDAKTAGERVSNCFEIWGQTKVIPLAHEEGWFDKKNVCNALRLQALVAELGRRGFRCNIFYQEGRKLQYHIEHYPQTLLVSLLPLQSGVQRVQLAGVAVNAKGTLLVDHVGSNAQSENWAPPLWC